MAARNSGDKPSSFAVACELLSRYVRSSAGAGLRLGAARADDGAKETMELFPQTAGFGERKPEPKQLTIFYKGKVLVFDDFPEEKAKELMQMASMGTSKPESAHLSNPIPAEASKVPAVPSFPSAASRPASDLPIMRKRSLHQFLQKRKDRINARAPYQTSSPSSPADAASKKQAAESQPSLHAVEPNGAKLAIDLNDE